jgi:hypothetical protein
MRQQSFGSDPESDSFLTLVSGIQIRDEKKTQKYLNSLMRIRDRVNPGTGMEKNRIRDPRW